MSLIKFPQIVNLPQQQRYSIHQQENINSREYYCLKADLYTVHNIVYFKMYFEVQKMWLPFFISILLLGTNVPIDILYIRTGQTIFIKSTSGERIWPVFSHNTESQCTNTDLLFQIRLINCTMVSPFILHCFFFSLSGKRKGEILPKCCR